MAYRCGVVIVQHLEWTVAVPGGSVYLRCSN